MNNKYKKILNIILFIIMILVCIDKSVYAIEDDINRNFRCITIEDGLSQSSVYSIVQDTKGYIWIGTGDGLNKYNGSKFEVYKYDEKENSICGNQIVDLKEDSEGNIWIGTTAGLSKLNTVTDEITNYLPNQNGCNISHYGIREILVTKSGDILVGTNDGLNIYDKENDNFIRIYNSKEEKKSLSNQEIYSLAEDSYGNYWVGTRNGLNRIYQRTGEIKKYFHDDADEQSISNNFIYSLHADYLGNLWIGTYYGGLNKLNLETNSIEKYMPIFEDDIEVGYIRDILRDSRGEVWVATDYGFAKFNEEDNTFNRYKSSKYNSGSLISDDITTIYEDKSGAIWIGTTDGISLFNPENLFNYYKSDPFDNNSLSSDNISGIYEDNEGLLWIGTIFNGLNIFDREKNEIIRVDSKEDYYGEFYISNDLVRDITGIDNEVWIATENGLNKYDKTKRENICYTEEDGIPCNDIKSLLIDSEGILWIGTRDGIGITDRNGEFIDYTKLFLDAGIKILSINDIYEDRDGYIWVATSLEDGLIKFNKNTKEIKKYNYDSEKKLHSNIAYNYIISITSDNNGDFWLATDYGIVKFNKDTGEYIRYTEHEGLPNNFIYGILFDDEGNLWASTNYGITKFNVEKKRFINFYSSDGLQGNEFNRFAYFKSNSGEMFFGGTNGLTSFKPSLIKEKEFIANVEIDSIYSNYGKIYISEEINLDYKNNNLEFKFFVPDYRDTRKITYAYRLKGLNKEWVLSDKKTIIDYTNLDPGEYEFQVAARNSSGSWSEPTSIKIKINTPPWKSSIAYCIYGILIFCIIYFIWNMFKILDSMVKQRTDELNGKLIENKILYSQLLKHEKYKNNYFINLSHELRTPLNIISSTQKVIENFNNQDKQISKEKMSYYMSSIKKNCTRLINLIDNIIYTSRIESGEYKLNIKEHDIVYLVEEIALSMKELMEEKEIQLIIEPYIEEKTIECDELEIERVILNLISNAIKFTDKGGTIEVFIWDLGEKVRVSIKDNGIGIDLSKQKLIFDRLSQEYLNSTEEHDGSGLGLTLNKQIIELHNGVIWVESELGKGSEFIVELPVKQSRDL